VNRRRRVASVVKSQGRDTAVISRIHEEKRCALAARAEVTLNSRAASSRMEFKNSDRARVNRKGRQVRKHLECRFIRPRFIN
jgi:hypothetical protein